MNLGLRGKTALVLGAGGGLGRAIAKSLARKRAGLAVGDIKPEYLILPCRTSPPRARKGYR